MRLAERFKEKKEDIDLGYNVPENNNTISIISQVNENVENNAAAFDFTINQGFIFTDDDDELKDSIKLPSADFEIKGNLISEDIIEEKNHEFASMVTASEPKVEQFERERALLLAAQSNNLALSVKDKLAASSATVDFIQKTAPEFVKQSEEFQENIETADSNISDLSFFSNLLSNKLLRYTAYTAFGCAVGLCGYMIIVRYNSSGQAYATYHHVPASTIIPEQPCVDFDKGIIPTELLSQGCSGISTVSTVTDSWSFSDWGITKETSTTVIKELIKKSIE